MSNGQTITITIAAATAQANAEMTRFFRGIQERYRVITDLNKQIQNGSAAANRIIGAAAAVFSAQAIRTFVAEAIEARKQQAQLEAALRSTGQASAQYSKELADQREAISSVVSADDDLLVSVQRQLISFGIQRSSMRDMTTLVLDLAAAMGTDAASAAMMFGRALSGEDVNFRGMRLEIDQTLPKAQQIVQAMTQLQARFGGQAQASFQAAAPAVERFGKSLGDARKEIGALVLDVGLSQFLEGLSAGLQKLRDYVTGFKGRFPELTRDMQETARAAGSFLGTIAPYAGPVLAVATAFAAVGGALRVLNPLVVLTRVGLAALAGVDIVGFFTAGAIATHGFATAMGIAAASIAPMILALTALAGAFNIANQARMTGRALDDEAKSKGRADAQAEQLGKFTATYIDKLAAANLVTSDFATKTKRELFDAHQAWLNGSASIDDYRIKIKSMLDVLPRLPESAKKAVAESEATLNQRLQGMAKLNLEQANIDAQLKASQLALQEKQLKQSYDRQEIDLATYLARRRKMIADDQAAQSVPLNKGIGNLNFSIGVTNREWMAETDAKKKLELEQKHNELMVERNKLAAALAQLDVQSQVAVLELLDEEKQLTAEYERQRVGKLDIMTAENSGQISQVENNKDITHREQMRQLIPLLQEKLMLEQQSAAIYREEINNPSLSDEARIEAQRQYNAALLDQANTMMQIRDLQANDSFTGTMTRGLTQLYDTWSAIGPNLANGVIGGISSAVRGVGDAIMGAIDGTRTWGQVFSQIGRQIIANIIQIVVQWIASMTIIAALKAIFGVKDTAQAEASATAWAPAALAASIASYGSAAAIGGAAFAAAMIAGTALAAGLSMGGGVAGRDSGGPVSAGTPYIVGERGPELIVPDSSGMVVNADGTSRMMNGRGGNAPGTGAVNIKSIIVADLKQAALEVLKSEPGTQHIIQTVDGRRLDIGMNT